MSYFSNWDTIAFKEDNVRSTQFMETMQIEKTEELKQLILISFLDQAH